MRQYADKLVEDPSFWSIKQVTSKRRVIFTNGCFDVLHLGHLVYLEQARAYGDVLIVGVNDDASVRALKGDQRPINTMDDRMRLLAAFECVDAVVAMHSIRNVDLLKAIQPWAWVKGGDYTMTTLNQEEVAAAHGVKARICIIPVVPGYSTTSTLKAAAFN